MPYKKTKLTMFILKNYNIKSYKKKVVISLKCTGQLGWKSLFG